MTYSETQPLQEEPFHERLATARRKLLMVGWDEADAREALDRVRFTARQWLLDQHNGDVKAFGPNAESQRAGIEAQIMYEPTIMDAAEILRAATRKRERAELDVTILLDRRRADEKQTERMAAVAALAGREWE